VSTKTVHMKDTYGDEAHNTPLMRQYFAMKDEHPGAVVLFQMGDFYEAFFGDAHTTAQILGVKLTNRRLTSGEAIPMAGVPYHAIEASVAKLNQRGERVVIALSLTPHSPYRFQTGNENGSALCAWRRVRGSSSGGAGARR